MDVKRLSRQTCRFLRPPGVVSFAAVAGRLEGDGPLGGWLDAVAEDSFCGRDTWEQGEAQMQADGIRADAQAEFDHRVGESEVYKEAFTRASGIAAEAEENATAIYNGARKYADEILVDLQRYLAEYHQMIESNRKELGVDDSSAPAPVAAMHRVTGPRLLP